jgi:hypothetical protein
MVVGRLCTTKIDISNIWNLRKPMILSIDLSLRSTGICVLDIDGTLKGFRLITPSAKEWNDEELLIHIADTVIEFAKQYPITAIAIEGLAYNSFSGEKDKINGNFWHLRCALKEAFPGVLIGIIPVTSWRSYLLSKEEQREIKKLTEKDALKKACVLRLPKSVEEAFSSYLSMNKISGKGMYDLSDAYHLGKYRLSL